MASRSPRPSPSSHASVAQAIRRDNVVDEEIGHERVEVDRAADALEGLRMEFHPLLPEDEQPLDKRTAALAAQRAQGK